MKPCKNGKLKVDKGCVKIGTRKSPQTLPKTFNTRNAENNIISKKIKQKHNTKVRHNKPSAFVHALRS
jgi:hypothetical protein